MTEAEALLKVAEAIDSLSFSVTLFVFIFWAKWLGNGLTEGK